VINTNLHPILHRFQVTADFGQIFDSESGVPHFNVLARVIPANNAINYRYIAKNYVLWPTFPLQKVLEYFDHFYVIRPEATEFSKITR